MHELGRMVSRSKTQGCLEFETKGKRAISFRKSRLLRAGWLFARSEGRLGFVGGMAKGAALSPLKVAEAAEAKAAAHRSTPAHCKPTPHPVGVTLGAATLRV